MSRFIVRRIVEIVVVLAIMSLVIYALIGLMPGDPVDLMIASTATSAIRVSMPGRHWRYCCRVSATPCC